LQEDKNICASFRCASVRKTDIASLHHREIIATRMDYAISVCDLEGDTSAEPRPEPPVSPKNPCPFFRVRQSRAVDSSSMVERGLGIDQLRTMMDANFSRRASTARASFHPGNGDEPHR
jgi:hypothetical protein